ncbi:MarR family winged helix-turn-helix transcriptional regulator [Amycolatopsis sp. H20-H5]|uniref:MarR family winged helix-turn-helix transcriptional regulator n=1 Tax=Amycolatopsis sp. H20-H5 TaxID=3046309 RepID=UPI002DB6215D|nr:MarR family transcriptional regulator [Amycolatopsis sp. H20-H5]MEC3981140.1 MarR family transcriptional regulator [Amycolatopsis sp. H20-H5]
MDLKRLFDDLIRVEIELWNAVDARLKADTGLPMTWFDPMQVIARTEACRVQDIASALVITVGGTSKLVDRIEAAGYCERRSHPDDRRSSIIVLTPAGHRILADATEAFEAELGARFGEVLSPRALDQLATSLAALRATERKQP